jgi:hypothetical protein
MGGVPREHVLPALVLLGGVGLVAVLLTWPKAPRGSDGDGHAASPLPAVFMAGGLGLAALLGPVTLGVAAALAFAPRVPGEGVRGRATAAALSCLSATALGVAVLVDAWRGLSPLGLPWGETLPGVPDLPPMALLLLVVPTAQAFCASLAAPAGPAPGRLSERLPLLLTFVMAMLIVSAVVFAWRDAPWTFHWGRHLHARAHTAGVLALLGAVRLVVVMAEHPAAPRADAVAAASLAAVGALTFGFSDSLTLSLPALVCALVVGRPARRTRPVRVIGDLKPRGGPGAEEPSSG